MIPAGQAEVAAYLAGLAGAEPLETHISAIFRGTDTVWKLKKAVRLGFLDFCEIEARRHCLGWERALNAPYVPGLYRDVVAITRGAGGLVLDGSGPVVDWVLRMAVVPEGDFLDAAPGRLDRAMLTSLADTVAAMHAAQPRVTVSDPAGRLRAVAEGNARAARAAGLPGADVDAWQAGIGAALDAATTLLQSRAYLVRRAHGDLHLGNLLLWQGRPAPFDALEFDEDMATIDPGYDLAFLLMDLDRQVSRAAANAVLNRYVARTGDAGLAGALPVFRALRAMVRAHVEASRGRDGLAPTLLAAALAYLRRGRPVVVAVGGLMGTGKSTVARAVAPASGGAPGALVLSSDTTRKRLFGVAPEERLPAAGYTPEARAEVLAVLLGGVRAAAAGGHCVIADATFLEPAAREAIEQSARQAGAAFLGVWLEAPLAMLQARVAARRSDASDADAGVLQAAASRMVPPQGWLRVDATDAEAAALQVQAAFAAL